MRAIVRECVALKDLPEITVQSEIETKAEVIDSGKGVETKSRGLWVCFYMNKMLMVVIAGRKGVVVKYNQSKEMNGVNPTQGDEWDEEQFATFGSLITASPASPSPHVTRSELDFEK